MSIINERERLIPPTGFAREKPVQDRTVLSEQIVGYCAEVSQHTSCT